MLTHRQSARAPPGMLHSALLMGGPGVFSCSPGRAASHPKSPGTTPRLTPGETQPCTPLSKVPKFVLPLLSEPSSLSEHAQAFWEALAFRKTGPLLPGRPPRSGHRGSRSPASPGKPCPHRMSGHGRVVCPGTPRLCHRHPGAGCRVCAQPQTVCASVSPAVKQQGGPAGVFRHCGDVGDTQITPRAL